MLFQAINQGDAEVAYATIQNVSGSALALGYAVVWDITSPDGVRVSQPATATLSLFVGCAIAAIANNAYGKVQVYGYMASAYVTNDTSQAIAAGNILVPVDGQWYLDYSGASDGKSGFVCAAAAFATATTPAAAAKAAFLRAL